MVVETIWFYLWGLLWAVYFMTGRLRSRRRGPAALPGADENDRRVMITRWARSGTATRCGC